MIPKETSLRAERLCFAYRGRPVLRQVSFELNPGELMCLLGPNGAGKSTLFRCILGLNEGYEGEILLERQNARTFSARERAQRLAYIPQHSTPTFGYTAFDTVLMGTTVSLPAFGMPGKTQRLAARRAIEQVGIEHLSNRSITEISGGERQLVLIARALAQDADFLLMDEPTANLDYGNQFRVMEMVRSLAGQGYGILLSTHNPEQAMQYGDRVLVLKNGQQLCCGSTKDVLNGEILSQAYDMNVVINAVEVDGKERRICTVENRW